MHLGSTINFGNMDTDFLIIKIAWMSPTQYSIRFKKKRLNDKVENIPIKTSPYAYYYFSQKLPMISYDT